ncbi:SDR family NAD(P)-dependent oxidoreductase [Bosea sp. (in: a-proteobacteria)]|jgi:NAD(P)-dependent dehydrogenase (short-subunit alcohol dehydrogenase family)|uniref:SDR family NAD(P)-dependent oxidoreductase n=1 Tax=Bosea sp. (in: a-proteobacteria) TaxID=1871050 RepID=UPI002DDCF51E|nr:SDR family NAD(P)-dependent oxidoreductase [Bosea sp. (in: a-proteobacteria)]HEV2508332.1 SDR family NAD(P)-dependent oxidoreductase [Bosea sp. (in: a-proteobacteria)]
MANSDAALPAWRLDGAVAAITGGARGIGRAAAELFAAAGARVVILDVDGDAARAAASAIGGAATAHAMNVADEAAVDSVFEAIVRTEGRLDVLVNNAGMALRRPTVELTLADWQRVVDVNMTGVFLCARAAGRVMTRQGSGAIVNLSSIMGLSGGGLYPNISYQTTKGAVVNMTRALAVEWARAGVRVNAVAPTWVDTEFIAALKDNPEFISAVERLTPMGRLATVQEVAQAILFLSSPAAAMITGHTLPVDGGFLAQ